MNTPRKHGSYSRIKGNILGVSVGLGMAALVVAAAYGFALNLVKLALSAGAFEIVVRTLGLLIIPLGAIIGYIG